VSPKESVVKVSCDVAPVRRELQDRDVEHLWQSMPIWTAIIETILVHSSLPVIHFGTGRCEPNLNAGYANVGLTLDCGGERLCYGAQYGLRYLR
jgi:hypothetical protein